MTEVKFLFPDTIDTKIRFLAETNYPMTKNKIINLIKIFTDEFEVDEEFPPPMGFIIIKTEYLFPQMLTIINKNLPIYMGLKWSPLIKDKK